MSQHLHIVCLDAPSPPDYGGAIDMHFKIRALAAEGKQIILHYFPYRNGRGTAGLEDCCAEIHAYERKSFLQSLPLTKPFIVSSRLNQKLLQRLNADNHPVLLEGLHCAGILPFLANPERVVLRMHNNEPAYYRYLAQTETSFFKKRYFLRESRLLHRFQQSLNKNLKLACLAETDQAVFEEQYGFRKTQFIACFHPWSEVQAKNGQSDFCLYHGNLQVSENDAAARWLLQNLFAGSETKFVIAGKGASAVLQKEAALHANVTLFNNPSISEIDALVREAQINVLPSLNNTGVKLKLLNALFNGRHCLTNTAGVSGSGLESAVQMANTAEEWKQKIALLMGQPFAEDVAKERAVLLKPYDNRANARKLIAIW